MVSLDASVSQQLFHRPISHFFAKPLGVTLVTITPQQLCIVKDEIETYKYSSSQARPVVQNGF